MTRTELAANGLAEISLLFAADLGLVPPKPSTMVTVGWLFKRRTRRDENAIKADMALWRKQCGASAEDTVIVPVTDIHTALEERR